MAIGDDMILDDEPAGVSLLEQLLDENNDDNVFLFDEAGNEVELEQIATVMHEGEVYAILRPLDAAEDEAVVFILDPSDEESIEIVEDDALAEKVLEIYHNMAE